MTCIKTQTRWLRSLQTNWSETLKWMIWEVSWDMENENVRSTYPLFWCEPQIIKEKARWCTGFWWFSLITANANISSWIFILNVLTLFHCDVYFSTNMAKCMDYACLSPDLRILICVFLTLPYDQPSSILFMPHSSWMFSASLSRTFSKWGGMTIWRDRYRKSRGLSHVYLQNQPAALHPFVYLTGFNRCGDEGGLRQELRCAQQVSDSVHVSLVLFHWLHLHLLFGQEGLTTRSVTRWRKEFKVTVSPAQQETHPGDEKSCSPFGLFCCSA